ncbi:MAG: cation:proton antiporter [Planctomycetaceae bacterium]
MSKTPDLERRTPNGRRLTWLYVAMIVGTAALFVAVRHYGETHLIAHQAAVTEPTTSPQAAPAHYALFHVLVAMVAVIIVGRLVGIVSNWFGQPRVIGEIVGGILLGPSFLGWVSPEAYAFLLPTEIVPHLRIIAQLGVILYMFLVGLELNTGHLRERGEAMVAISHASIVLPFLLGVCLSLAVYPRYSNSAVSFTVFSLFFGVSLSVTAFPVLARILSERGLTRSHLGTMALACAAADDVTAWCLLAVIVGVAQSKLGGALVTVVLAVAYIALMFLVVRPIMARMVPAYDTDKPVSQGVAAFVFVALLLSAIATELIGIHAIFGAFLLGAMIPHDSRVAREFIQKLEDIVAILLLPAFFAVTGMRTELNLVSGFENILFCITIIIVATIGKFAGSAIAGRLTGLNWREASAIGILMNTRGLMGLIVLNIGLDLDVISPQVFAMLVLMALVTTLTTAPVLDRLIPPDEPASTA